MVSRTILRDLTMQLSDGNFGRYGLYFRKTQSGGDWPVWDKYRPPKPDLKAFQNRLSELLLVRKRLKGKKSQAQRFDLSVDIERLRTYVRTAQGLHYFRNAQAKAAMIAERQRRKGENHVYTMTMLSARYGAGDVFRPNGTQVAQSVGFADYAGLVDASNPWTTNDDIALANKLGSMISQHVDFHAGVAAAEVDKTAKMVGGMAKKLARSMRKAAKGDLPGALRILGNTKNTSANLGSSRRDLPNRSRWSKQVSPVRDRYLEYQFGIKPLLDDVQGAMRALAWQLDRPQFQKVRVRQKRENIQNSGNDSALWFRRRTVYKQAIAILTSQPSSLDALGITDVASIAWERLPFSFMVDWWIPVGNYLQAVGYARMFSSAQVVTTTKDVKQRECRPNAGPTAYTWVAKGGGASAFEYQVDLSRTVNAGISVPLPSFKALLHPQTEVRIRHTLETIGIMHGLAERIDDRRLREQHELEKVRKLKRFGRYGF